MYKKTYKHESTYELIQTSKLSLNYDLHYVYMFSTLS